MVRDKIMRVDQEFTALTNRFLAKRVLNGVDKELESPRRFSKAVARTIEKNIDFQSILLNSPFENDRKKGGGRKIKLR